MNAKTKREFTYANGEYNSELEVEATLDGLELSIGPVIPWDWIDAVRQAVVPSDDLAHASKSESVLRFENDPQTPERGIYACNCNSVSFRLFDTGEVQCARCGQWMKEASCLLDAAAN